MWMTYTQVCVLDVCRRTEYHKRFRNVIQLTVICQWSDFDIAVF